MSWQDTYEELDATFHPLVETFKKSTECLRTSFLAPDYFRISKDRIIAIWCEDGKPCYQFSVTKYHQRMESHSSLLAAVSRLNV